jgi:hypothetical protein
MHHDNPKLILAQVAEDDLDELLEFLNTSKGQQEAYLAKKEAESGQEVSSDD